MSDQRDDGGQAFPQPNIIVGNDNTINAPAGVGMTLRQWFAGQALANMRTHENSDNPLYWQRIAESAYACADAMLKESAK